MSRTELNDNTDYKGNFEADQGADVVTFCCTSHLHRSSDVWEPEVASWDFVAHRISSKLQCFRLMFMNLSFGLERYVFV